MVDKIWQNTTSCRLNVSKWHSRSGSSISRVTYSCESEHWKNGISNWFAKVVFAKITDAVCCDIDCRTGYNKVLYSLENAHYMLKLAAKCSNYARN